MSERSQRRGGPRLPDYDYSQPGAYFVTMVTQRRLPVFGRVRGEAMELNPSGEVVRAVWLGLGSRFVDIDIDEFVVMPDHMHGIVLILGEAGAMNRAPTTGDAIARSRAATLGGAIRAFKAATTRLLRTRGQPEFALQPNYYEHIVRGESELNRIRRYISENPIAYALKHEEPALAFDTPRVPQRRPSASKI